MWQKLGVDSIARRVFGWAVYLYLIPLPALAINTIGHVLWPAAHW